MCRSDSPCWEREARESTENQSGVSQPVATATRHGECAFPYANASPGKARGEYVGGDRTVSSGRTLCVRPASAAKGVVETHHGVKAPPFRAGVGYCGSSFEGVAVGDPSWL